MNYIKKTALFFSLFVLVNSATFAQELLTNKEIINLQTAKVSQDVILAKISASKSSFDLTAQGLIELDAAKISDKVIKAMFVASPPMETMTNDEVIKLSNSEVSTSILKEKIAKTAHKFDVGSEALIKLKTAKVSDSIVKEMILNPTQGAASSVVVKTTIPVSPTTAATASHVSTIQPPTASKDIIVTKAYEEVKNLKRVGEISASASKMFGKQDKLRIEAIEKLKKEAALKGATHVLIQDENFAPTPTNTVSISGVAYKK